MKYCSNCGEELAPGAKFCANCGKPAVAPGTTPVSKPEPGEPIRKASAVPPVPPPPRGRSTWWILPAVIIGVIVIVFLILVGMPFGGSNEIEREQVPLETIGESTTTAPLTATIVDATTPTVTETAPPPMVTHTTSPPNVTQTVPPATATTTPVPAAPTATTPPAAAQPTESPRQGELGEREAAAILRRAAARYYDDVSSECIEIRSHGYVNVGYTMTVWNSCASGGIRMLGRWRVDSEKGEVFRQRDDGRYLEP